MIHPKMWDSQKFHQLSIHARLLWCHLLTAATPVPGLIITGVAALAEVMRYEVREVELSLHELSHQRGSAGRPWLEFDREARVIRIPAALKYHRPGNPNVLRGWYRAWQKMPASDLVRAHVEDIRAAMNPSEPMTCAWAETFGSVPEPPAAERQLDIFKGGGGGAAPASNSGATGGGPGGVVPPPVTGATPVDDLPVLSTVTCCSRSYESGVLSTFERHAACLSDSAGSSTSTSTSTYPFRRHEAHLSEGMAEGMAEPFPKACVDPLPAALAAVMAASGVPIEGALWALQERARARIPGAPPLCARRESLGRVAAALRVYSPTQLVHALAVFAGDAHRDPPKAKFFNGVTNWDLGVLERAVGMPAPGATRAVRPAPAPRVVDLAPVEDRRAWLADATAHLGWRRH